MNNKNYRLALRIFLPVVIILFFACITFFPHVHIVDSVTIVHSHPFHKGANGHPTHTHTWEEIYLISVLSSYQVTTNIIFFLLLTLFLKKINTLVPLIKELIYQDRNVQLNRLRPPPISL